MIGASMLYNTGVYFFKQGNNSRINGSLLYAIEYFLFLLYNNYDVKLLIFGMNENQICDMINDRYSIKNYYLDNIVFTKNSKKCVYDTYKKFKFKNAILSAGTFQSLDYIINAQTMHVFNCWMSFSQIKKYPKKENIFNYNEIPVLGDINYSKKIYWDIYKQFDKFENKTLCHITETNKDLNEHDIELAGLTLDDLIFTGIPPKIKNADFFSSHPMNFAQLFNRFWYIAKESYDYAPRLLVESFLYKKNIIFQKFNNVYDGASIRYKAIQANCVDEYLLNSNDLIMQRIASTYE